DQRQQLHHRAVQPGSRDDVDPPTAGKYGPTCALLVAGEGIKDHPFPEWRRAALCGGHRNWYQNGVAILVLNLLENLGTQFTDETPRAETRRRNRKER